ncbi:LssY C-terminal domain-containing protein [Pseudoclavibacter sp. 13-3]|uniref:LssY C-terminal domain-containing protein n=1 Tax=Pseudoclavibacter sp. 13-3 TaxID=2901228 RepID=UPI001E40C3AB|nr:LssY C-terminal domain-containing protein [Pseudoclavibacter sp. 13-3]MCD7102063.1 LssY C-terminal domain-containing protein [Pseudoclavibacter sp. 13-3]
MNEHAFHTRTTAQVRNRTRVARLLDGFFFVFAAVAAFWLAFTLFTDSLDTGWWGALVAIVFWALIAYLALPRLHRILTSIYVPDYFIGRTRTSDGLLGDPVNLALLGDEQRLHQVMDAAGWTRADDLGLRSSIRIVTSTLSRRSYREAPVSPLFLFGRQQDFAYQQEVAGNPAKRHHVRFWRCPPHWLLPGGHRVDWLAAGTFDRAVGLSLFTLQVTHKIDENTDIERDHIVASVLAADDDVTVHVLRDFSTGYHSRNGGGDSIRTDGDLPIVDLRDEGAASYAARRVVEASDAAAWLPGARHDGSADAMLASSAHAAAGQKRPAFELLDGDSAERSTLEEIRRHGRPVTTTFGAAVLMLRALTSLALMASGALLPDADVHELVAAVGAATLPQAFDARCALVLMGLVSAVGTSLLALLVLRGSDLARMIVLVFATLSTLIAFASHAAGLPLLPDFSTLVTVTLNILILMALSGRPARAYATTRRERRSARTASTAG